MCESGKVGSEPGLWREGELRVELGAEEGALACPRYLLAGRVVLLRGLRPAVPSLGLATTVLTSLLAMPRLSTVTNLWLLLELQDQLQDCRVQDLLRSLVNCHLTNLELTGLLPTQVETVLGLVGPDTRLISLFCSVTRLPCRLDRVDPHLLATAVNRTVQVGPVVCNLKYLSLL